MDRHGSDQIRLSLVPVRRSRQAGRVGLYADHERQERQLQPSRSGCRLQDPFAGDGDERRRLVHGNVEPYGGRYLRQTRQHDGAVDLGHCGRRRHSQGEPRPVGRDMPITYSFVWLRCNDKGDNCSEIRARTTRSTRSATATPAVRSASASLRGTTVARHLRSRTRPASSARTSRPRPSGQLGGGGRPEGGRRSSRHRVGSVLAESGDEPDRSDHRACPGHRTRRPAGQWSARVHARNAESRVGSTPGDAV